MNPVPPYQASPVRRARRVSLAYLMGVVLIVASVLGAAWGLHSFSNGHPQTPTPSNKDNAATGNSKRVVCLGYVDAEGGIISLTPTVAGRVAEINVKENETVKAGTILLKTEDDFPRHQLEEAQAALKAAETRLKEARKAPEKHRSLMDQQKEAIIAAKADLGAALQIAERKRKLYENAQLPEEELKAAEELAKKAEAGVRVQQEKLKEIEISDPADLISLAQDDVKAKKAQEEKARRVLAECELRAPSDGTVLRLFAHRGDMVSPQSPRPALLFCPSGSRIVRGEVEQEFAPRVALDQPAKIQDDSGSDSTVWTGRVTHVADWFSPRRNILPDTMPMLDVRTLECIIKLDPGQTLPRIGQRVRVTIGE